MDWTKYEADMEKGTPRQLLRLKYDMTSDSYTQLQEAFIFHWRYALRTAKHQSKRIVQGRCPTCGRRHYFKPLEEKNPGGGGLYCAYGWFFAVRYFFSMIWYAGKHGED